MEGKLFSCHLTLVLRTISQIKVKERHRGLVLRTVTGGLWWGHVPGYGDKGTCITHVDSSDKQPVTFVFRTHRDETPEFSGIRETSEAFHAVNNPRIHCVRLQELRQT